MPGVAVTVPESEAQVVEPEEALNTSSLSAGRQLFPVCGGVRNHIAKTVSVFCATIGTWKMPEENMCPHRGAPEVLRSQTRASVFI